MLVYFSKTHSPSFWCLACECVLHLRSHSVIMLHIFVFVLKMGYASERSTQEIQKKKPSAFLACLNQDINKHTKTFSDKMENNYYSKWNEPKNEDRPNTKWRAKVEAGVGWGVPNTNKVSFSRGLRFLKVNKLWDCWTQCGNHHSFTVLSARMRFSAAPMAASAWPYLKC